MLFFIHTLYKRRDYRMLYAVTLMALLCLQTFAQSAEPEFGIKQQGSAPPYESLDLNFDILEMEKHAANGNLDAQIQLAWRYEILGVTPEEYLPNREKALYWFGKAAQQGSQKAAYQVKRYNELRQLEILASNGDAEVQFMLAKNYYFHGMKYEERETNKQRGLYWYMQAGNNGHMNAILTLGLEYNSVGDTKKAIYWLARAVEKGSTIAEYALGGILISRSEGKSTKPSPENISRGMALLRNAADGGIAYAQLSLGNIYHEGTLVEKDDIEALKWFSIAVKDAKLSYELDYSCRQDIERIYKSLPVGQIDEFKKRYAEWISLHGDDNYDEAHLFFIP